ncbi:MAG: hypothetical protein AB7Y46_02005 [Armatimonadota bacterium]
MGRGRYLGGSLGSGRRGQALLIAVLLMMAILLVGILFVALVTYNQSQSARHEDMVAAQALAEAGIRYAVYQLHNSTEGADWRPPDPPAMYTDGSTDPEIWGPDGLPQTDDDYYTDTELTRGWAPEINAATGEYVRRGYTRYPDPLRPGATTEPANDPFMGRGYFLLRVSYDPWEPGDPAPPDPMDWHIKIESIGRVEGTEVFRKLVAYKPISMLDYARFVHDATGDGRPAQLGVPPYIDMDNDGTIPPGSGTTPSVEWISTTVEGPVRVNGLLQLAGGPHLDGGTPVEASTKFLLLDRISPAGFPRRDVIEVTGGIDMLNDDGDGVHDPDENAAEVTLDDGTGTTTDFLLPSTDPAFNTFGGHVRDGLPGTSAGEPRFVQRIAPPTLTLGEGLKPMDRYRELTRDSGDTVEYPPGSGDYVTAGMWGFGAGIYIDNFDDTQFNHQIDQLIADWQRPSLAGGTPPPDSGWNALMTTYAPPGVKIELLPTEAAAGAFSTALPLGAGEVWWPNHEPGQPGIRITRYDGTWRQPDGTDSGERTIVMDYPTSWLDGTTDVVRYPVIMAEGNVRISGQLPPAIADAAGNTRRTYELTVVSNATIYIDGQLLSPNDYLAAPVPEERNTKIALLARDCVCLNTTQIVPQLTTGTAPAVPDDPLNPTDVDKHWELAPGSDGRAYSVFFWGGPPNGSSAALVVRQTAGDPGPSGVSLTTWVSGTGYSAYTFGTPPPPMVPTTFVFVPPGAVFPDGSVPPQPYGIDAIAPNWAPYRNGAAALPWDLAGAVDPTPGLLNGIILQHADPHLSAGSTSYWLKKWKIAEYNGDGLPVGAINARVNAAVYAERGCWYVLTSDYFDETVTGPQAVENRRYNYQITFTGTIAENFTASVEAAQDWTDKLAWPAAYAGNTIDTLSQWGTIQYHFDETLRLARFHGPVAEPAHPAANLPRMPLLPVSPDLAYYGEAQ